MQEYNILAPKIFSNDPIQLQFEIINIVKQKKSRGLEIALYDYHDFSPEVIYEIQKIETHKKMLHLWQKKVYLNGFLNNDDDVYKSFFYENNYAKNELKINKAIIHNNKSQTPLPFDTNNIENIKKYAHDCFSTLSYCYNKGLKLHIENIYENLNFFEIFFNEIIKFNMNQTVGFCLDTGHVRVFSQESLNQWLNLIHFLNSEKISIHYHIHLNDGHTDQHLSLSESNSLGLLDPISAWTPDGYLIWLKSAFATTPNAIFCQEHSALQAKDAFQFFDLLSS